MSEQFDPYYKWLGIPPEEQPAHFYRLLGLRVYEPDFDVIQSAVDRMMAHLRTLQVGQHALQSQQILNEVSFARITLLDPVKKHDYDTVLQRRSSASLEPRAESGDESDAPPLKTKPTARGRIVATTLAVLAVAIVITISLVAQPNLKTGEAPTHKDEADPEPTEIPSAPTSVKGRNRENDDDRSESASGDTLRPTSLTFDFSDEALLKKYWTWKYKWTFAANGGKAGRGAQSSFRSRHPFSDDLTIEMEFHFDQAGYSNTGGCWVAIWGQRLLITNGWRSLNAKIHIHREKDEIVYTYNGKTRRLKITPEVSAKPTHVEIRWRSRASHFKRIEIKSKELPLVDH